MLTRRKTLQLAASTVAMPFVSTTGRAQAYPSRPVRVVIPFPVGGSTDANARIIGQPLTERWGQSVIVDPRPGGGTIIGSEHVAKSAPDGHTLLLTSTAHTVNPVVNGKLPYDTLNDFVPITIVSFTPMAIVANPSLPANTVKELIAFATTKPGQLNYG